MELAHQVAKVVSIVLFLYYGVGCLFSRAMVREFDRFGLSRFRRLTGALELLGGVGLLAGYLFPVLVVVSSTGLSLLMLAGLAARLRVRDSLLQMMPALILLIVNVFIVVVHLRIRGIALSQ